MAEYLIKHDTLLKLVNEVRRITGVTTELTVLEALELLSNIQTQTNTENT